jgi:hypothetical protein
MVKTFYQVVVCKPDGRHQPITDRISKYIEACKALAADKAKREGYRKITQHLELSNGTCEWLKDIDEATAIQSLTTRKQAG